MDLQTLQPLPSHFHGVWAKAQAKFYIQRATTLCQQSLWAPALNMLGQLCKLSLSQNLDVQHWRLLLTNVFDVCGRSGKRKTALELIDAYIWLGWSGQSKDALPWALQSSFWLAERHGHFDMGAALGDVLAKTYPDFALAPYASAHFRELNCIADGNFDAIRMNANAQRFGLAASLAQAQQKSNLQHHCILRQGVTLMLGGTKKSQARQVLRQVDATNLSTKEQLWYMIGMSRSDFWLDRVRSADILDQLATLVTQNRPMDTPLTLEQIQRCVEYLFAREGLDLQSTEEDRLQALIELVFVDARRDQMQHMLSMRSKLHELRHQPLSQSTAIAELLSDRTTGANESWRQSASSFRFLTKFALRTMSPDQVEPIPRQAPQPFLIGAHAALELLHARQSQDMGTLLQSLRTLLQTQQTTNTLDRYPERLSPLACAWPNILEWLMSQNDEDDAANDQRAYALELIQDNILIWAKQAPAPGYGWWVLAAHLLDAKLTKAARVVAVRAIESHTEDMTEYKTRDHVMGQIIADVLKDDDRISTLKWLEYAETLYN